MLIDLTPDFLAVIRSADRMLAYQRYFEAHRRILAPYWHNYVLDPDSQHFPEVVRNVVGADREDLLAMLARIDLLSLARDTVAACSTLLDMDVDIDVVLMVGVGAANAGELVVDGRGIAFACLEHFTGTANPGTQGLGLDPELLRLWLAHEIAHTVRYTSPTSRSEMRELIGEDGGSYSYWSTGRRATLRELLVNEGLAVETARAIVPGCAEWEYFGYGRRHYARIRQMESVLLRTVAPSLDTRGLGLRLTYLSGGLSPDARTVGALVVPERAGYYVGSTLVERAVAERGLAWAVRASAPEITDIADSAPATA